MRIGFVGTGTMGRPIADYLIGAGHRLTVFDVRPAAMAPLIAAAYGLSDRERTVTQLVAQGYATAAIAGRLHVSPWTVQDHLKAIFEKVGVHSRKELVGHVFFEHYLPAID